ncbi:MAG: tetratricopeptide repeat protein [Bacteroidales bacterium]|nr:tetratricopeptide repeat protein [Bacteroidales bacterium]
MKNNGHVRYNLFLISLLLPVLVFSQKSPDPDSLLRALYLTTQPSEQIEINNLLAEVYFPTDPAKSNSFAQQALFLSESIDDRNGKAIALYHLARIENRSNDIDKSLEYLNIAMNILKSTGDQVWLPKIYTLGCLIYKKTLEYENALNFGYKALKIYQKAGKDDQTAMVYMMLGGIYFDLGNYAKSRELFEESLATYTKLGKLSEVAVIQHNIGEVQLEAGNNTLALTYFEKAIPYFRSTGNLNNLGYVYNSIGNVYLARHQYDSVTKYLSKSYEIAISADRPRLLSAVAISRGNFYLAKSMADSALFYFKIALNASTKANRIITQRDALLGLSKVFEVKKEFDSAYQFHKKYKSLSDSIIDVRNQYKITRTEMNYLYEHENQLSAIRQQNVILKYLMIAAVLFVLLVFLVLIYGRQKIKLKNSNIEASYLQMEQKNLQEEIDNKNRELTTHVMYLVKKNELINYISERLQKTKSHFKSDNQKKIEKIILDLQKNIDGNIWSVFEQRFQEVHQDFYKKLNENYPNLTDNDKKLCAFLKLNMTTKEIANVLHQNPNSVEVARTRLRKKLGISGKEIGLTTFLTQI